MASGNSSHFFDDPMVLAVFVMIAFIAVAIFSFFHFEVQISAFTMHLAYYAIWPIDKLLTLLRGQGLNYYPALAAGQLEQNYLYAGLLLQRVFLYYSPLIISTGAWLVYRSFSKNTGRLVTGALSRDDIWAINAYVFTSSLPTFGRKIETMPTYTGEWRINYSPVMYCARYQILEIYSENQWQPYPFEITRAGHLSRQYAATHQWRMNPIKLKEQFKQDLGVPYINIEDMIARSPIYTALLYICSARIIFGREEGYFAQDRVNRYFASVKKPSSFHPVPRIKPLPLTVAHLGKCLKEDKIVDLLLDMIDFNQARIEYLRDNLTALNQYYNAIRMGEKADFVAPEKSQSLKILQEQFADITKKSLIFSKSDEVAAGSGGKWAESEIEKINQTLNQMVDFDKLMAAHAYYNTLIYRLYAESTRNGVFTTADFIWLRPLDQTLFFALNNKGREAAALMDGAAVHYHALSEMRAESALLEPEFTPLIQGVEYEINEFFANNN